MVTVADNSFLLFVYPFLFAPSEFDLRVRQIENAVCTSNDKDKEKTDKVWEVLDFPGDEMLAYVADYLNPRDEPKSSTVSPSNQTKNSGARPATARLWRLTDEMQPIYGLADWADWRLKVKKKSDSVELTLESLKDPFSLVAKLRTPHDSLSQFICARLGPNTLKLLEEYDPTRPHIESLLEPLLKDLNQIITGPWIYDENRFAHVSFTDEEKHKLKSPPKERRLVAANRSLLEKAYPLEILDGEFGEIPFRFGELAKESRKQFAVQLALFGVGVGFLTVRARPESEHLDDWLTFLSIFRYVRGQRTNDVRAQKRRKDPNTNLVHEMPFFPKPAGGVSASKHSDGSGHFTEVLDSLLRTASLSSEDGEWWNEVFIPEQTLPFATLFVDDIAQDEIPELIYKVRNFFTPSQGPNPAPEDLRLDHPSLIAYARDQWFVFSLDGGAFVACNAPHDTSRDRGFFRETLPDHLRDHYFILFLIVLQQRFLLMSLSQQVADVWPRVKDKAKVEDFDPIRDALLEFTARGMFTQVMQSEHHHRCYRKWQEIFQIKELYQEVRDEVGEMHDFLRMKRAEETLRLAEEQKERDKKRAEADSDREKRIEKRFKFVGLVFGVPALIIGFLGINLVGITTKDDGLSIWLALAMCVGSGVIGGLVMMLINIVREQKTDQRITQESSRRSQYIEIGSGSPTKKRNREKKNYELEEG